MKHVERDIIIEMTKLLEKMAVESFVPVVSGTGRNVYDQEAVLINLKAINAKYDKHEAVEHVRALRQKYNIQIDELLEQLKY